MDTVDHKPFDRNEADALTRGIAAPSDNPWRKSPNGHPVKPAPEWMKRAGLIAAVLITIGVVVGSLLLGWASVKQSGVAAVQEAADKNFEDQVKAEVASTMRNPNSAQFKNVFVWLPTAAACGEVNGTNAFGGYTGFKSFAYHNGNFAILEDDFSTYSRLNRACLRARHLSTIATAEQIIAIANASYEGDERNRMVSEANQTIAEQRAELEKMARQPLPD